MKARCLLGHRYKRMPLMRTRDGSPRPHKACVNCGKIRYDWVLYIPSIEGSLGSHLGPQWEGQSPPPGYDSWKEVYEKRNETIQRVMEDLRKRRR